jgi:hypothetical protein
MPVEEENMYRKRKLVCSFAAKFIRLALTIHGFGVRSILPL